MVRNSPVTQRSPPDGELRGCVLHPPTKICPMLSILWKTIEEHNCLKQAGFSRQSHLWVGTKLRGSEANKYIFHRAIGKGGCNWPQSSSVVVLHYFPHPRVQLLSGRTEHLEPQFRLQLFVADVWWPSPWQSQHTCLDLPTALSMSNTQFPELHCSKSILLAQGLPLKIFR